MSSYFSRLMQQTEIAIGTGETKSREVQPDETITPFRDKVDVFEPLEPRGAILAITTSQEEQLERQENFQIKGVGNEEEKLSLMGKHRNTATQKAEKQEFSKSLSLFNQNANNRNDSSSPKSARTVSLSSGDSPQSKGLENWAELSSKNQDVGTGLNFPNEQPKVRSEKILESRTKVVQQTQPLPETSLPKLLARSEENHTTRELKRVKTRQQPIAIPQKDNPLPTHQVNLQTVREWVAGTENAQLNTESLPSSQTQPQKLRNSGAEIENSRSNSQIFQFTAPKPQAKPNFMVSIGTISLTVEAPQTEVKQPPLPPMKSQQEVKPVSSTSRLNRHYLRL